MSTIDWDKVWKGYKRFWDRTTTEVLALNLEDPDVKGSTRQIQRLVEAQLRPKKKRRKS
jgi:hypothetical protein